MKKRLFAAIICVALSVSFAGCGKTKTKTKKEEKKVSSTAVVSSEPKKVINPLTGLDMGEDADINTRPVAIMINNMSLAQPVQTGVNKADIVYETEVEGGITRLMAVFKNINSVGQIGTVRSARYPYVDLANGHDAVYLHCGQDPKYCAPHLKDIDDISIDTNSIGTKRISNGLATEHTLYAFGNQLTECIENKKIRTTSQNNDNWVNFADEDETVTLSDGVCNKVSVAFSSSYKTSFVYDSSKGKYTRYFGTTLRTDYLTKETTDVKNVFVLLTTISDYSDNYHRQVALEGGEGYYISNGNYQKINWKKGSTKSAFSFTDLSGNEIKVNAGKSWVMISDKTKSQPVFE